MAEERPPRVGGAVDRRFMTRVEQEDRGPDQLVLGQPVAAGLDDRGQLADQVVAGSTATRPGEIAQIRRECRARVARPVLHVLARVQLEHQGHVGRPRPEQVAVRFGDAEELRDHRHGDELEEVGDQVELANDADAVDHRSDDSLDPRPQRVDRARREGL